MTEPTNTNTSAAQSAKAAQCSVIALLENIKAIEHTTEAVKELFHRLSSINKALGRFASAFDQSGSCKLSHEVQRHLQMAIWINQDACARYQDAFKDWTSHFINDSLRDSDWNPFGAFVDIKSQLLSERLQLLRDTLDMAMEISALLATFSPSKNISDEEWNPILAKEIALLSAVIKANKSQQAHQLKERAAQRIACEIKGYGIAMQHHRKIFDGLLSEFRQLRWGQRTDSRNEDQLPPNAISDLPDQNQFSCHRGVIYMKGTALARYRRTYDNLDGPLALMVHPDLVSETAD